MKFLIVTLSVMCILAPSRLLIAGPGATTAPVSPETRALAMKWLDMAEREVSTAPNVIRLRDLALTRAALGDAPGFHRIADEIWVEAPKVKQWWLINSLAGGYALTTDSAGLQKCLRLREKLPTYNPDEFILMSLGYVGADRVVSSYMRSWRVDWRPNPIGIGMPEAYATASNAALTAKHTEASGRILKVAEQDMPRFLRLFAAARDQSAKSGQALPDDPARRRDAMDRAGARYVRVLAMAYDRAGNHARAKALLNRLPADQRPEANDDTSPAVQHASAPAFHYPATDQEMSPALKARKHPQERAKLLTEAACELVGLIPPAFIFRE